jgi:hypothetical protein
MDGKELAQLVRTKLNAFKELCGGIDEATASRAPEGRWSPKEIVSHLLGEEGVGMLPEFKAFIEKDMPFLDLEAANSHFTGNRATMTFSRLLEQFDTEYQGIADFVAGLSSEQLDRKAHIPAFKESPLGEYISLGTFIEVLADHHLGSHIDHMREILQGLGVATRT